MEGARFDQVVARRADLRFPLPAGFASRLEGHTVRALDRRGKHLIASLSSGQVLLMHLGMSGSFRVDVTTTRQQPDDSSRERGAGDRHDHIVFHMSSGATITFNDPRRFGSMDLLAAGTLPRHGTLGALGPEPLSEAFDAARLAGACRGKTTTLKAAVSDQRVVAGLGNIYVCEALHRARLSPRRRASTIATASGAPREAARRLVTAIKRVLNDAVRRSQRAEAADDRRDAAYFPNRFRVYDREGARCPRSGCRGIIR